MENHPLAVRLVREKRPEFKSCFEYSVLIGDSDASLVWSFLGDSLPCLHMSKMKVHHRVGSQGDFLEICNYNSHSFCCLVTKLNTLVS